MSKNETELWFKCPLGTCGRTMYTSIPGIKYAPWCRGVHDTHSKEMVFMPDKSTGEPAYDWRKKIKKETT